jgi:phosphatidylserine/phosphatidylglycerophosphate/cardiolipin synthase-like enzyme
MNQNLTKAAFTGNREYGVVTDLPQPATDAQEIFDADWARRTDDLPNDSLIVSPDNSRARFADLIASAGGSIDFYAEVIRDTDIMDDLGAAVRRGVQVRIITNPPADDVDRTVIADLLKMGVEVRIARSYYVHAKMLLIDGVTAVVGSQNFTPTSLDDNREVAMVIDDGLAVARCRSLFALDWQKASPATAGSLMPDADTAAIWSPVGTGRRMPSSSPENRLLNPLDIDRLYV